MADHTDTADIELVPEVSGVHANPGRGAHVINSHAFADMGGETVRHVSV